jgi:hypothetical protein
MRGLALLTAASVLAAVAPADAAPALTAGLPCYGGLGTVELTGAGFTPNGPLELTARWSSKFGYTASGGTFKITADAAGAFTDARDLPDIEYDSLLLTVTAKDLTRAALGAPLADQFASTRFTVAYYGADYRPWNTDGPARAHVGRADVFDASGFVGSNSRTLFIHYLRGGHLVKTLRVGQLAGPCAALSTQLRQFDFQPVPRGTYRVRFDTTRGWPNDEVLWAGYKRVVVGKSISAVQRAPSRRRRAALTRRGGAGYLAPRFARPAGG